MSTASLVDTRPCLAVVETLIARRHDQDSDSEMSDNNSDVNVDVTGQLAISDYYYVFSSFNRVCYFNSLRFDFV